MSAYCRHSTETNLTFRGFEIDVLICDMDHDILELWHTKKAKRLSPKLEKILFEEFTETFFWEKLVSTAWESGVSYPVYGDSSYV